MVLFFYAIRGFEPFGRQKARGKVAGGKFSAFWCEARYQNAKHLGGRAVQDAKQTVNPSPAAKEKDILLDVFFVICGVFESFGRVIKNVMSDYNSLPFCFNGV